MKVAATDRPSAFRAKQHTKAEFKRRPTIKNNVSEQAHRHIATPSENCPRPIRLGHPAQVVFDARSRFNPHFPRVTFPKRRLRFPFPAAAL